MASELEWAWLAGLMDGDGCFLYRKCSPPKRYQSPQYSAIASLEMTSEEGVKRAAVILGGFPVYTYEGKRRNGIRQTWALRAGGVRLQEALPKLIPHLTVKRLQAEMLLQSYQDCPSLKGGPGNKATDEELAVREGYYLAMRQAKAV